MTSMASVSHSELGRRRQQLRRARSLKFIQGCWQLVAVSGIACSLVWVTTRPGWVISNSDQVIVKGNQFLSAQTIRSLLSVQYPQSILKLQPEEIAEQLETAAPIAQATVNRHLFPPGLTVQVKERYPVALAQIPATNGTKGAGPENLAVLDQSGWWTPLTSYTAIEKSLNLPQLKVIGNPEQYQNQWPQLYQALSHSAVKISEIDWQDPANIVLGTELGKVHIGPDTSKVAVQLKILDRMRNLPKHPRYHQIDYIDLKNPESPTLKIKAAYISTPIKAP
jgi:cell division protein FtsQ